MEKSKEKKLGMDSVALSCLGLAVVSAPFSIPYAIGIGAVGVGGFILDKILDNKGENDDGEKVNLFEKIFFENGVYTGDSKEGIELPRVMGMDFRSNSNSEYNQVALDVPIGITLKDLEKCKLSFKEYLKCDEVKFEDVGYGKYLLFLKYFKEDVYSIPQSDWNMIWAENNFCTGAKDTGIVYPKLYAEEDIIGGKSYKFTLPIGKSTYMANKFSVAIQEFLGANSIKISSCGKSKMEISAIYEDLPVCINYEEIPREKKEGLEIVLGKTIGTWARIGLDSGENGILITGKAGSGKSNCFKTILTYILSNYSPDEVHAYLGDFKIVELAPFEKCKHVKRYVTETEDMATLIDDLESMMKKRYELFKELDVENIYSYNKKVSKDKKLPFILFAIEEISAFTTSDTGTSEGYNKKLAQLNYRSRACGFLNMFCVQRMTNVNIPREVSNSLGTRICFKVADEKESKLITDGDFDLNKLRGKGHGVILSGGDKMEFQAFKLEHEEILPILKKHKIIKSEKEELDPNLPKLYSFKWDGNITKYYVAKNIETFKKIAKFDLQMECKNEKILQKMKYMFDYNMKEYGYKDSINMLNKDNKLETFKVEDLLKVNGSEEGYLGEYIKYNNK